MYIHTYMFILKAVFQRHLVLSQLGTQCGLMQKYWINCVRMIAVQWQNHMYTMRSNFLRDCQKAIRSGVFGCRERSPATHCNTLQHTVTHCNTLYHTVSHCNTLQNIATECNTLQHAATRCITPQHTATPAIHCNTLQHLQHTATHCNKL